MKTYFGLILVSFCMVEFSTEADRNPTVAYLAASLSDQGSPEQNWRILQGDINLLTRTLPGREVNVETYK